MRRNCVCFKCGKRGHKAKECHGDPYCMSCTDPSLTGEVVNHTPGEGRFCVSEGTQRRNTETKWLKSYKQI